MCLQKQKCVYLSELKVKKKDDIIYGQIQKNIRDIWIYLNSIGLFLEDIIQREDQVMFWESAE